MSQLLGGVGSDERKTCADGGEAVSGELFSDFLAGS